MDNEIIVDSRDKLTTEELEQLKDMARYWGAGKILVSVIVALGAFAVGAVQVWDFLGRR